QAARQCEPSLQDDGLQPRQLLPLQGALRQRRRTGAAGDQPQEAGAQESGAAGDRGRYCCARLEQPAFGHVRIATELRKRGLMVSAAGVRCVWQHHDLETMNKRLKALEARSAQDGLVLTEAQLAALEKAKTEGGPQRVRERAPRLLRRSGYILLGNLKGVSAVLGRV